MFSFGCMLFRTRCLLWVDSCLCRFLGKCLFCLRRVFVKNVACLPVYFYLLTSLMVVYGKLL